MGSGPHSDYFSDTFRPRSNYSSNLESRWPLSPSNPHIRTEMDAQDDTATEAHGQSRPKPSSRVTEPALYLPRTPLSYGNANVNGPLRYPYTPDSARMLRRSTERPMSPTPWDECSEHSSSPVQNALSSCIAHFENLIHSQQPDEDQMEYIVAQFEAMTSYLSAPESQTRTTDEHLFSEQELEPEPEPSSTGLGIIEPQDAHTDNDKTISRAAHDAYVAEVGSYIEGVKGYIKDLKMRLDEIRTLNSIQLDVINGLRQQMRTVRRGMRSSIDMRDEFKQVEEELDKIGDFMGEEESSRKDYNTSGDFGLDSLATLVDSPLSRSFRDDGAKELEPEKDECALYPGRRRIVNIIRKPERRSFWTSFGHALDAYSDLLLEN
jgi:hypothetical protein